MAWFADWGVVHWLVLAFLLLILEIIVPGIFFLWWGIAGLIIAAITYFVPLSLVVSVVLFAVIAIIASIVWWRYQVSKNQHDDSTTLNQRGLAMLGQQGRVTAILGNNTARAAFGDTTWRIEGSDLQLNDQVEVVSVRGITLLVRKL
ncbi:NfeD family protein [Gallibacterium genomosp. 3]|uniref:Membrane protein n=1 Tax=Gallibacterium genomosp. 3 TaxID=505345 RepID=A0A1A7PY39_9PAST|nr:NfeD family protein [Gallibacterium genomosp. 3]OBX07493.1 membrane protein [Gallibacterium genomosp. 3]